MNEFGDERKMKLESLLDPTAAETLARIALETEPIVLGITFWNCFRPWRVPERRICDNFFFMTVSGEELVEVAGERFRSATIMESRSSTASVCASGACWPKRPRIPTCWS